MMEEIIKEVSPASGNEKFYYQLGYAYHKLKKYDKAKEAYENAIKLDPSNMNAINNLEQIKR